MSAKKKYLIFILMLSYSIISIGYAFYVYKYTFTTEKWIKKSDTRVNIVENMLKENKLKGKTKSEIHSLLGKEDTSIDHYSNNSEKWFYELGKRRKFLKAKKEYLIIQFQNDSVIGFEIFQSIA